MSLVSKALSLENSCELIVKSVRNSCLNFSIQETPYSLYLTIRKSFSNVSQEPILIQPPVEIPNNVSEALLKEEIKGLKMKLSESEDMNHRLRFEHEEVVNDSEECHKKLKNLEAKIFSYREDNSKLENDLGQVEKNWKVLNKQAKEKDKEIYNLKKENKIDSDNLAELKLNFLNLSASVNKDKKKEEKKQKKRDSREFLDNLRSDSKDFQFQCDFCDVKSESQVNLKKHIRFFHMKSSPAQTNNMLREDKSVETYSGESNCHLDVKEKVLKNKDYENYRCFYCRTDILSEQNMLEHRLKCHGVSDKPSLFSLPIRPPRTCHEKIQNPGSRSIEVSNKS